MAHTVKRIARGPSTKVNSYAGPAGELVMDTTTNDLVLENGVQGGVRMAKASTAIAATNGLSVTAGGTLGEATTVSGVDATTAVKGVVQLSDATTGTSQTKAATEKAVSDALQAAKDYADQAAAGGGNYTGTAPIAVDTTTHVVSIADASTSAKGAVQLSNATTGTSQTTAATEKAVADALQAAKDYTDSHGTTYTGTAPINVSGSTISVSDATTAAKGVVQLTDSVASTSTTTAATPSSVKQVYDFAVSAQYGGHELCEVYYFLNPTLRPGFVQANGALISNARTLYPAAFAYLQTVEGSALCVTEATWQSMSTAIYYTDAAGNTEGWNGIGGVPKFVINTSAGTIRVPDLRGMYMEAAGLDSLAVGGVHHDKIRNIEGNMLTNWYYSPYWNGTATGAFDNPAGSSVTRTSGGTGTGSTSNNSLYISASRVIPTGSYTVPRAFGALACVYLGA